MGQKLEILLDDDDLLVVNKPAGVLTIPDRQGEPGLQEAIAAKLKYEGELRLVHRLDRQTSGVLVLAKTLHAQRVLSKQFKERLVKKQYLALVHGRPGEDSGLIDAPLAPHPKIANKMIVPSKKGRPSQTQWQVVERFRWLTLVRCLPRTGRQHQIRVHLAHVGMPLLVDDLYGESDAFNLSTIKSGYRRSAGREERPLIARLTLHAEAITFQHPGSDATIRIEAPLPKDFRATLNQLRKWSS